MYRVYACLTQQHDPRLVLVAGLICLFASWTALSLVRRGLDDRRHGARPAWLAAAAAVAGCGVWATHFVAMLAFSAGLPIGYAPGMTAASVLVAVAAAGGGLALAAAPCGGTAKLWLAGAVAGAGVGAMHYTGMAALRVSALVNRDAGLVAASLLLGAGLGAAAVRTALGGAAGPRRMAAGALLLTAGICAAHFIGTGTLRLEPTSLLPALGHQPSPWWLASGVAGAAAVILAAAAAGLAVDRRAGRGAREAARLRALGDAAFEDIVIHAEGTILDLNQSLADLIGRRRGDLLGASVFDALAPERAHAADARPAPERRRRTRPSSCAPTAPGCRSSC